MSDNKQTQTQTQAQAPVTEVVNETAEKQSEKTFTQEQLNNINDYVVIYPENLRGSEINALNTKKFVRWLLNDPFEYLSTWNNTDEIIYFVD